MSPAALGGMGALVGALLAGAAPARAADGAAGDDLARLAARRVIFAHQSVGAGLVAGLERLAARTGAPLRVVELREGDPLPPATFGHAFVERNGEPRRKLAAFAALLDAQPSPPDVALLKFCYVDFDAGTDPQALFAAYQAAFQDLARRHPRTAFVHVTTPLTVVQGGWRAALKRLLGRAPGGFAENVRREAFNDLLRQSYRGPALFDLAALEATDAAGRPVTARWGDRTVRALDPAATADGGHPDAAASDRLARALAAHLAGIHSAP